MCQRYPGGLEGRLASKLTEMAAPCFAELLPRPAVCCALRKPDLPAVCPGFGLDMFPGHALHDLSSPKPGHTTGGSGRHGARRTAGRGDAGQNKVPTFRSAWKPTAPLALQGTVNNCSERLFASTNKGNPM